MTNPDLLTLAQFINQLREDYNRIDSVTKSFKTDKEGLERELKFSRDKLHEAVLMLEEIFDRA